MGMIDALGERHPAVPRVRLGHFPTPLHRVDALGKQVGIDQLWLKRDDLTGFSWGGNKVRTAEFLLGQAVADEVQELVVSGGPSSNFVALMTAAAATVGITVHQVSYGNRGAKTHPALAASAHLGSTITFTGSNNREQTDEVGRQLAEDRRDFGRKALAIPRGGATAIGSLGFLYAALELQDQIIAAGIEPRVVVIPVGSGGSVSGLLAGAEICGAPWTIFGPSVSRAPGVMAKSVVSKAVECAARLGHELDPASLRRRIQLFDARGAGFGAVDASLRSFTHRVETATGFNLDPVYNAKALDWLADAAEPDDGTVRGIRGPVIYWHTGGLLGSLDHCLAADDPPPQSLMSRTPQQKALDTHA